ncbi:MAG: MqnA/MqnD/SBP family protein [Sulfurimonadaceae bacterium]|nr:MqnA/MqnD/SBP family protein [Sulfurimonadaceae bacterium]
MVFGKIDYLNLLPFYVFMKRYAKSTRHHLTLHYKKGVPSKINRDFATRRIDAAFISSIEARRRNFVPLGIIAKKEVLSVLLIPGDTELCDTASATSNVLARVLGLKGEVVIGDNALRRYLEGVEAVDLAGAWYGTHRLPFVFALLCHHGHGPALKTLGRHFLRGKQRIPQYLLKQASAKSGVSPETILHYLEHISYDLDGKAEQGLRKFWKLAARLPRS